MFNSNVYILPPLKYSIVVSWVIQYHDNVTYLPMHGLQVFACRLIDGHCINVPIFRVGFLPLMMLIKK